MTHGDTFSGAGVSNSQEFHMLTQRDDNINDTPGTEEEQEYATFPLKTSHDFSDSIIPMNNPYSVKGSEYLPP